MGPVEVLCGLLSHPGCWHEAAVASLTYHLVRETLPPPTNYFHPSERRETSLQRGFDLGGNHKKRDWQTFLRKKLDGRWKTTPHSVLGSMPEQHRDDPESSKLYHPQARLDRAGGEEGFSAE